MTSRAVAFDGETPGEGVPRASWHDPALTFGWGILLVALLLLTCALASGAFACVDGALLMAIAQLFAIAVSGMALRARGWSSTGSAAEIAAQFTLSGLLAPLVSIVLARTNVPYRDDLLLTVDARLFNSDWQNIIAIAKNYPLLNEVLSYAYNSIMYQPVALLAALLFMKKIAVARVFCTAWVITLAFTMVIFPFVPARGGYLHLGVAQEETSVLVAAAWRHVEILDPARNGTLHTFSMSTLEGVVTFPSFHAAAAALMAWVAWSIPLVRWPALILNLLMIASTPIIGGHYLVDVAAGIILASSAIALARRVSGCAREDAVVRPFTFAPA